MQYEDTKLLEIDQHKCFDMYLKLRIEAMFRIIRVSAPLVQ